MLFGRRCPVVFRVSAFRFTSGVWGLEYLCCGQRFMLGLACRSGSTSCSLSKAPINVLELSTLRSKGNKVCVKLGETLQTLHTLHPERPNPKAYSISPEQMQV